VGVPALGIFLAWLRTALGYHTIPQVVVGWLVGSATAAVWLRVGHRAVLPALHANPLASWGLVGITAAAVGLFSVLNVARWVREERGGAGSGLLARVGVRWQV
jgi:dolichyldiphosphatase